MKVILYYPPLVLISAVTPYPSLPVLSSYLKSKGKFEVTCKDINIDVINKLTNVSLANGVTLNFPVIKKLMSRGREFLLYEKMRMSLTEAEHFVLEGLKLISNDLSITYDDFDNLRSNKTVNASNPLFDYWNLKFDSVKQALMENKENQVLRFLGKDYFKEIPEKGRILIGISVAFITQFAQAVSLAAYIKRLNPEAFIVFGGPIIYHLSKNLHKIPEIFDAIDCFVEVEGEDILYKLAQSVSNHWNWQDVEGIIFRNADGNIIKNNVSHFDIRKNKAPDYSLINNHNYLDPSRVYLRTSTGCYYNKCSFCTLASDHYQQRPVEDIVNDIASLKKLYNLNMVLFSDNAISLRRLSKIADELIKKKVKIKWHAMSRFDVKEFKEETCKKLRKSNCFSIFFGLESGSQRINNLMNKGTNLIQTVKILKKLKKYGIRCSVGGIIGFPGETEKDVLENIKFLKTNWSNFYAGLSIFGLNYRSHVYLNPRQYGISKIEDANDFLFKENYDYLSVNKIPYEKLITLKKLYVIPAWKKITRELWLIYRRFIAV